MGRGDSLRGGGGLEGWTRMLASAEDTPRLPWPVARHPTGAASSVTTGTGSLSEFYYHSNEDVERYFI